MSVCHAAFERVFQGSQVKHIGVRPIGQLAPFDSNACYVFYPTLAAAAVFDRTILEYSVCGRKSNLDSGIEVHVSPREEDIDSETINLTLGRPHRNVSVVHTQYLWSWNQPGER